MGSLIYASDKCGLRKHSFPPKALSEHQPRGATEVWTCPPPSGAPTVTAGGVAVPTGITPYSRAQLHECLLWRVRNGLQHIRYDQLRGRFIYNRVDSINTLASCRL